jgi:hypothetical protein
MATSVYVSLLITADDQHRARVQRHRDGVIASVDIDTNDCNVIQSADPQALRALPIVLPAETAVTA